MLHTLRKHYILSTVLAVSLAVTIIIRMYFTAWLTGYVNGVLYNIPGYRGSVQDVSVDLYRSAYHITRLRVLKLQGHIPVPFIDIEDVDFSLQWNALLHGRIVSKVYLTRPVLNFATSKSGEVTQTGEDMDWTHPIKDLMPIDINEITVKNGEITYKDFSASPQVNIYVHGINGKIANFRNVVNKSDPLPSRIAFSGESIGAGKLRIRGHANILKKIPDFKMEGQIENIALPALNDYTDSVAAINFNDGTLSVYSELTVQDGQVSGYVKPIANNANLIDLKRDRNPIKIAWEAFAATLIMLFSNHAHHQFATKVELSGNLNDIHESTWSEMAGIMHNAFIQAFEKKIDHDASH